MTLVASNDKIVNRSRVAWPNYKLPDWRTICYHFCFYFVVVFVVLFCCFLVLYFIFCCIAAGGIGSEQTYKLAYGVIAYSVVLYVIPLILLTVTNVTLISTVYQRRKWLSRIRSDARYVCLLYCLLYHQYLSNSETVIRATYPYSRVIDAT